jgi:hypothetical protein
MAVTTAAVLAVLLAALGALAAVARGLGAAAAILGVAALVCFGAPRLVLGSLPAAALGLVLYAGALALWRPAGLASAWGYLRELG